MIRLLKRIGMVLWYWLPPFVWMGLIFFGSSKSRISVTHTYITDFIIFKTLHIIEYAALYALLFRSFYSIKTKKLSIHIRLCVPFLLAILFAFTDEFHQLFIPTRQGAVRDIFIDTIGIYLMYSYIKNHIPFLKRFFL